MIQPSAFQARRQFFLAAICVILAACSTMQKSSTGTGEQASAPISDAGNPLTTAKPGERPNSPVAGAASAPAKSNSNSAKSADAADPVSGNTGAKQGSSESSAESSDNEEAVQLKRRLAEQDAQINKLRNDQLEGAQREETDAAMQREQQSAAAGTQQPALPGEASTTASRGQDE